MKKFYYDSLEEIIYYNKFSKDNTFHYFDNSYSLRKILDFAIPFEEDVEDSKIVTLFLFARRNK